MDINDINLKFLTDDEVEMLMNRLQFEKENRKNTKAQELWGNVIKAMKEYYEQVGDILIDNDEFVEDCSIVDIAESAKTEGILAKKWG